MFPPIEPHDRGWLDVGDGHAVHWEVCGAPEGKPAVVLHGGPGAGCAPWWRQLFDPARYRVVLFDQRGCGRSRPSAGEPAPAALEANTTHHLVADVERLRAHLGVERWLVLGGSWGSTLALAYAQAHPESVSELVLLSVVTTTRAEIAWVVEGVGPRFPAAWRAFRAGVPAAERDDLVAAYRRRLLSEDPAVHGPAAEAWCRWEDAHVRTDPSDPPDPRFADPAFRLTFARLVTHYWHHAAWLEEDALLHGVPRIAHLPATLVHGRRDRSSPLTVPRRLAAAWPAADLVVVDAEGHRGGTTMASAIVAATTRYVRDTN